jgi:two-component system phosphate regulon sensor histidine kinase PhoR
VPLSPLPMTAPTASPPTVRWPIVFVGGVAVTVVLILAITSRLPVSAVGLACVFVALATAVAAFAADRASEARAMAIMRAVAETGGEPPPYASLINALPDPIMVISATEPEDLTSRRYVFANSAARQLLRIERGEGLLVGAIRAPEVLDAVDLALFGARDAETVYETTGAQPRVLKAYARPLGLGLDERRLALLVFRDETEMRQVERTRADFLANASHELRTPLASLAGFIETLRGHARDDPGARERFLGIMQSQAERMSRLIDDLMSLSRIELNEHIAPSDQTDLTVCVTDVLDALAPIARDRGVTLKPHLPPPGVARVAGDRDQIIQVAQNLVDNALKYSQAGGAVQISVDVGVTAEIAAVGLRGDWARMSLLTPDQPGGSYAVLRVTDEGPGMAREHLPRLTERFYRVEGQKSGERAGTGLGLAIVKHIANRHRGGLAVESAVGQGTTFTAYFPLAQAPAATAPIAVAKAS